MAGPFAPHMLAILAGLLALTSKALSASLSAWSTAV